MKKDALKRLADAARHPMQVAASKPGMMAGGDIYLGCYEPFDRKGVSLGKIFNVFAQARDLPRKMNLLEAWKEKGVVYGSDRQLYEALKTGSYTGGWVVPPKELLNGYNKMETGPLIVKDILVAPEANFLAHQNTGAFEGTFEGDDYLSCSSWSMPNASYIVSIHTGVEEFVGNGEGAYSCRLVRFVELKL